MSSLLRLTVRILSLYGWAIVSGRSLPDPPALLVEVLWEFGSVMGRLTRGSTLPTLGRGWALDVERGVEWLLHLLNLGCPSSPLSKGRKRVAKSPPEPAGSSGKPSFSAGFGGAPTGAADRAAVDAALSERCPFLHLFLTALADDTGKQRKTATLMLFAEDGRFRSVLHDRQTMLSLWRDSDSLTGCLEGLEGALASGRAEWRKDSKSRKG